MHLPLLLIDTQAFWEEKDTSVSESQASQRGSVSLLASFHTERGRGRNHYCFNYSMWGRQKLVRKDRWGRGRTVAEQLCLDFWEMHPGQPESNKKD